MPALTREDVANLSLDLLTEGAIESLEADEKSARLLKRHMDVTRESELTKVVWNFSVMSTDVDPSETGVEPWAYAYEMPADALRVLPFVNDLQQEVDWRIEGSQVYTMIGGSRKVRYVGNLVDPNDMPSLFIDVWAAALAIKIAHPITGKASMIEVARQAYKDAVSAAKQVNAFQKQGRAASGLWEQARGGGPRPYGYARSYHGGGWR